MAQAVQVSFVQLDEMRHALGLGRAKKPYRNYFYTESDDAEWNDLVEKGLAKKSRGWETDTAYFRLTMEGVKVAYGKVLSQEAYNEL